MGFEHSCICDGDDTLSVYVGVWCRFHNVWVLYVDQIFSCIFPFSIRTMPAFILSITSWRHNYISEWMFFWRDFLLLMKQINIKEICKTLFFSIILLLHTHTHVKNTFFYVILNILSMPNRNRIESECLPKLFRYFCFVCLPTIIIICHFLY